MSNTLTWRYETLDQARNAKDELREAGVPMENLYIDEPKNSIKVIIGEAARPGIVEILERHGLSQVA